MLTVNIEFVGMCEMYMESEIVRRIAGKVETYFIVGNVDYVHRPAMKNYNVVG